MAKYSQVKNFHFCGFMQFKRDNLLKTKDGSTWKSLSFSVTDGNNSQFVKLDSFGKGQSFNVLVPNEDGGYDKELVQWNNRFDEELNINYITLNDYLNNRRKTNEYKGYIWKYYEED